MDETNDTQASAPENTQAEQTQTVNAEETQTINWEEKAKGLEAEAAKWKRIAERNAKKADSTSKQSDTKGELDYGMKAYLRSEGIDPTEFDFVQEQIEESGITELESLIKNPYFQSTLKDRREKKAIDAAIPGKTRISGDNAKSKVDYWVEKGELPPNTPENTQLRRDVLNKRLEVEGTKNRFTSTPIIGG